MIKIFTDGAARGNPGPGGWGAIVADDSLVYELGGREDHTTNNRMELLAAASALESISGHEATVVTDSAYVLNGITRWVKGWQRNGWKTSTKEEVLNRDFWERLVAATEHKNLEWRLVKGHAGHGANERCDAIATAFADGRSVVLYRGAPSRYGVRLDGDLADHTAKSKSKAYSYVSMVDGIIETHKTWEECKRRVHGASGARYKKSASPEEEMAILQEFHDASGK